jgi:MFS transporter, putative metabolite:H+ symporter
VTSAAPLGVLNRKAAECLAAIGFVYSWSRLSAALSGPIVAFLLHLGGVNAVFSFIALAMAIVVVAIGGFGPRTRGLALEAIAH